MGWNRVAVAGAGLIKFGELFEQSYEQMAAGAFQAAVANVDRGIEPEQVDAVFVATQRGTLWGQEGIGGNTVPTAIGLAGVPCTRIENACPSGSDAFRRGAMAVASRLLDCCPQTDGAAATILVNADRAAEFTDKPVYVAGFGVATDHPYLHEKQSFTGLKATTIASERAYRMAGVEPSQIDCAEVHDCFTITELLAVEDLGFFDKGKGGIASLEGETSLTGRIPVNTSGGLLAKGHPIGATGVAQLTECWWQRRGGFRHPRHGGGPARRCAGVHPGALGARQADGGGGQRRRRRSGCAPCSRV